MQYRVCLISGYDSHLIKQVHSLSSSGVLVYLPVFILRGAIPQWNLAKTDC